MKSKRIIALALVALMCLSAACSNVAESSVSATSSDTVVSGTTEVTEITDDTAITESSEEEGDFISGDMLREYSEDYTKMPSEWLEGDFSAVGESAWFRIEGKPIYLKTSNFDDIYYIKPAVILRVTNITDAPYGYDVDNASVEVREGEYANYDPHRDAVEVQPGESVYTVVLVSPDSGYYEFDTNGLNGRCPIRLARVVVSAEDIANHDYNINQNKPRACIDVDFTTIECPAFS